LIPVKVQSNYQSFLALLLLW